MSRNYEILFISKNTIKRIKKVLHIVCLTDISVFIENSVNLYLDGIEEMEEFQQKIKDGLNMPITLTPTPKLEDAKELIKEYLKQNKKEI